MTSQITGVKYKPRGSDSYTIPYGATDTLGKEEQVREEILGAIPANSTIRVSFKSEQL